MLTATMAVSALIGAGSPARAEPPPPNTWVVNWGEERCSLLRRAPGDDVRMFALRTVPGSYYWDLRIVDQGWRDSVFSNRRRLSVRLGPSGIQLPNAVTFERTTLGRAVVLYQLDQEGLDMIAQGATLRVVRDDEPVFEMALPNLAGALAALRECEVAVLRDWGMDPVAYYAVRQPPRGNLAREIDDDDYPSSSADRNEQGLVVMRMTVGTNRRIEECAILVSSGFEALDRRSCDIARIRFRPEPAIGADGAPVRAPLVASITWRIVDL